MRVRGSCRAASSRARASRSRLRNDPAIVLADEPTGEFDATTAERVLDLLREQTSRGAAVLVVTHNADVADAADREIQLLDGRVSGERRHT